MKTFEKIIFHIPIIGLIFMISIIGGKNLKPNEIPSSEDLAWPTVIQGATITILIGIALISILG